MSSLIVLLELGLVALLLLLAFRVLSLVRNEPLAPAAARMADSSELITQLHILTSLQARHCKEQGLNIEEAPLAVKEYTTCWLYGSACALSSATERDAAVLSGMVSRFVSRKVGMRQPDAVAVIANLTRQTTFLWCFRSGIEAAKHWQTHHFVPQDKSLFEAVTSNAFI